MDQHPMTGGSGGAGEAADDWPEIDLEPGPEGHRTGPDTLPLDLPPLDLPVGDIAIGTIPTAGEGTPSGPAQPDDTTDSTHLTSSDRATWTLSLIHI
mgnify:CR=1 FL=1